MQSLLTLSELAAAAANAVQASGVVPDNRQAKPIPAERMIRYYTARGLLPRPGTRGRALTYGRTHLLRLVAIKRLQSQGLSLDEIGLRLEQLSPAGLAIPAATPARREAERSPRSGHRCHGGPCGRPVLGVGAHHRGGRRPDSGTGSRGTRGAQFAGGAPVGQGRVAARGD